MSRQDRTETMQNTLRIICIKSFLTNSIKNFFSKKTSDKKYTTATTHAKRKFPKLLQLMENYRVNT